MQRCKLVFQKAVKAYMLLMPLGLLLVQVTPEYDPSQGSVELQVVKAVPTKVALNAFAQATADRRPSLLALIAADNQNNKYNSHSPDPVRLTALFVHPSASRVTQSHLKRICTGTFVAAVLQSHDLSAELVVRSVAETSCDVKRRL